jgi:hypothetical protein
MAVRKYSSRSQKTTLASAITSSSTSITVVSAAALMGGKTLAAGQRFTVVIDPDTALEEIVDIYKVDGNPVSGNTLSIARLIDGSIAQSHSAGAEVRHMAIGQDYQEANDHINNVTNPHGLTIADVITTTNTKTITGKTISAADNTLTGVVTLTGSQALTNKTLTSPTINGGTVASATITGVATPTNSGDAAPKSYVDSKFDSSVSAATSAAAAATSATAAANSATSAASSASAASTSASTATTQATSATNSATSATSSASSATSSASSASTSASTATTKASEAATSATNAATSATSAATSATNAASSATAAAGSATSAAASLASVTDQVGSGLARDMGSITESDTSSGDWIDLSDVSDAAASSATAAASSASAAATSASSAATQATNASSSATAAAGSATAAAASYDSFDDRYLGAKSSAPSVDNDGNALITGALYFNSTTPGMYVWTGSAWTVMATSGDIESVAAGTGLSGGGTAGAVTVSLDTSSVYVVPSQSGNTGKFLTTDGTSASWVSISDWGTL